MMLHEITDHQWVILETMHDAWVTDATRDEGDYTITQQPSTTYAEIAKRERIEYGDSPIAKLIDAGGCVDADMDEILVYDGSTGGEWCKVYIPSYWD